MLSIFNVKTGTLVLNFDVTAQNVSITVNGLHFERIYDFKADCESALSARLSGSVRTRAGAQASKEIPFPPQRQLPKTEQIIDWINKNKFAGTQQPFAEFVAVFERAGDLDGAKIVKSGRPMPSLSCHFVNSSGFLGFARVRLIYTEVDAARSEQQNSSSSIWSTIEKPLLWCEKLAVAGLDFILFILADYGYKPERMGWFVAITVFGSIFMFPYWLEIVGYTVEGNRDKVIPIGVLFIFDRMLPTYRIREDNYKIERYYVVPKAKDDGPKTIVRHLGGFARCRSYRR